MSFKAQVTGQFALTDESTNQNRAAEDLSALFTTLTGKTYKHADDLPLVSTDGQVALSLGTLSAISMMLLWPEGGNVIFRHDTNVNGITLNGPILIQGSFATPTVETSSTSTITVHYVIVG